MAKLNSFTFYLIQAIEFNAEVPIQCTHISCRLIQTDTSLRIKQQQQPSKAEEKEEKDSKSMGIISSSVLHNTITYNI